MSPSLDGIVIVVVEQLQAMERHRRRSPRPYTKRLKNSSLTVPTVALPTGPLPAEPWYDEYEDEAEVPLIGGAILAYHKEHSHRSKMTAYQSDRAIVSFLTASKLHENEPIFLVTRERRKNWRGALVEGQCGGVTANRNKRLAGAVTIHPKGSPLVSMWFSRLLTVLQIKRPEVSLHLLRHMLTVLLAKQQTYPPLQNRLLRHAIGKSVEDRVYLAGLTFSVKELAEALEKVRFA